MKLESIRKKSDKDLAKHVNEVRTSIRDFRREKATNNSEKNKFKLQEMKKELAQTLTVVNEKTKETK